MENKPLQTELNEYTEQISTEPEYIDIYPGLDVSGAFQILDDAMLELDNESNEYAELSKKWENYFEKKVKKQKRLNRVASAIAALLTLFIVGYFTAVYSQIPFIVKWRTIYIETAMSTMTHQWLATLFIPSDVVDKVMSDTEQMQIDSIVEANAVEKPWHTELWIGYPTGLTDEQIAEREFKSKYTEIDMDTLPENILYKNLYLDEEGCKDIKTINGDEIYTIDTLNGIVIIKLSGDGYQGKMAIIKDSSQVSLAKTRLSYQGQYIEDIMNDNDAIMAMNASGFVDPNGRGNGGTPVGLVISNGVTENKQIEYGYWFSVGLDNENNMRVGTKLDTSDLRDAVQFKPALIIDGEKKVNGSSGWGIQPRSVIAQTQDKQTIFFTVDGRKPGYSIGITVGECADILLSYGAVQAINLDGGASTVLAYNGETINTPSTRNPKGRWCPNAWIVSKKAIINTDELDYEVIDVIE